MRYLILAFVLIALVIIGRGLFGQTWQGPPPNMPGSMTSCCGKNDVTHLEFRDLGETGGVLVAPLQGLLVPIPEETILEEPSPDGWVHIWWNCQRQVTSVCTEIKVRCVALPPVY